MLRQRVIIVSLMACLLAVTWLPSFQPTVSLAKGRVPDTIRIALFIDTGKFYRGSVPTVTLSPVPRSPVDSPTNPNATPANAARSLTIGERAAGKLEPWFTIQGDTPVQLAGDYFSVSLFESAQYAAALNVYNRLPEDDQNRRFIEIVYRQGKPAFRVLAGWHKTRELALSARQRWLTNSQLKPLLQPQQVTVIGNSRLQLGVFDAETNALALIGQLRQKGFHPSWNIVVQADGTRKYAVTAGEATDPVQLSDLRSQLMAAMPEWSGNNQPQPTAWSTRSYLHRKELAVPTGGSQYAAGGMFTFNPLSQRVHVASAVEGIRVKERENRVYRGQFEIREFNGSLTVINELPFDSYLCSVVGAEMGSSFPKEALRAQAVIARTYAVAQGTKYQIANLSDTTFDQAYYGTGTESVAVNAAVRDTHDELLMYGNELVSTVYFANAGGQTAVSAEVWGGNRPYYKSVRSPDELAERGRPIWLRVATPGGQIGYVHGEFVQPTATTNPLQFKRVTVTSATLNLRPMPSTATTNNTPITVLKKGEVLTVLDQAVQSNSYSWIEGPYSAEQLREILNRRLTKDIMAPLRTLTVNKRGVSGRVTEMSANGEVLTVSSPDAHRSLLGGLRSTLFDIDETGRYTVLGASGSQASYPQSSEPLYVLTGSSVNQSPARLMSESFVMVNGKLQPRAATLEPQFRFIGKGHGHGLGLSQWGARGLAEQGMKYEQILLYYYSDVKLAMP